MSFAANIAPTAVFQSAGAPCAGFLANIGDGATTSPHHATGRAAIHLDTRVCYPSRRARRALYVALTWLYSCDDMVS
jgi:hypothetical protein